MHAVIVFLPLLWKQAGAPGNVCVCERESCFISSQATVQEDCACHVAHCVCLQGEYYLMLRGSMSCKMDFGSVF